MIIQLLKQGVPVLTAHTRHTKDNSRTELPVRYEGNTGLLPPEVFTDDAWDAGILSTIFNRIADEHGLAVAGDYIDILPIYGSVDFTGYPSEPGHEDVSRG
jgi:hypothetical protein